MSQNIREDKPQPEVLIVGAGIGGLMLAILLDQINISYQIFERASEVRPLGSAMSFNGCTFPFLDQLGIYEELRKVSKPYSEIAFYNANLKKLGSYDTSDLNAATGYSTEVFARPRFHDILRNRVPENKINFKKKVVRTEEKNGKVIIHCSDDTSYTGDILVGADGAYSGVRQNMYEQMDKKGILPKSDLEDFSINYITVVGVTSPFNLEKYPRLKDENSSFNQVLFGDGANCYVISLPNNQISWGFGIQISEAAVKELKSNNSEWGPEANDATLTKYRDFPCPLGGTMGDLFDATPKDLISKVFLEEKMFKSWHHGRTVLIGDGARNAMEDAVVLANSLYFMKDTSASSVGSAFEIYYRHRYKYAEQAFNASSLNSKILNGQKLSERLIRNLVLNFIPNWVMKIHLKKNVGYRQQIAWLPLIEDRGEEPILPQEFEGSAAPNAIDI
ncbi:hypothetical protein BGZ46_006724 [Entomortierella lignicola]|nr:hypothetical protein BGZ46_006724 [Entomortierella lignicola]